MDNDSNKKKDVKDSKDKKKNDKNSKEDENDEDLTSRKKDDDQDDDEKKGRKDADNGAAEEDGNGSDRNMERPDTDSRETIGDKFAEDIAAEANIDIALKEAEIQEGDVVEVIYNDEHVDDQRHKEANDIIKDIMAEEAKNRDEIVHEKKDKKFAKRTLIRKIPFTIGNLDVYLHVKYQHINVFIRCLVECIIIAFLFLTWPILLYIILPKTKGYNLFTHLTKLDKYNPVSEYLRQNVFIVSTYFVFIMFSLFFDNILYVSAFIFNIFGVAVKGKVGEFLQVISASKNHLRNTCVSLVVFIIAINLVATYEFFSQQKDVSFIFFTLIFWFSCVSCILFVKTFFMNYLTSELRRQSFRGRIWDTNYKTFVFKKLAAIAEATPQGKRAQNEIIYGMHNDYDTGFFLRHNDLELNTKECAKEVAEGIFGYLEVQELTFKMIKRFFPENYGEVYNYLSHDSFNEKGKDDPAPITYEMIAALCLELYQERMDIARSLYDRDNILRKLDFVLTAIVGFFGFIIFFILIDIDYKIYIASVGPFLFGFGWIFQDSIKELYRCFIFHLINHPFDCGDRVQIDNEDLVVLRIDLLYTTYTTLNGKIKYIPNASMFYKNVINIRRSDTQAEDISILVDKGTKFSQMLDVNNTLSEEVKRLNKEFTGVVFIKNYELVGDIIKVIVTIEHTSNFQEHKQRLLRRDKFIEMLEKTLDKAGVSYNHCFTATD